MVGFVVPDDLNSHRSGISGARAGSLTGRLRHVFPSATGRPVSRPRLPAADTTLTRLPAADFTTGTRLSPNNLRIQPTSSPTPHRSIRAQLQAGQREPPIPSSQMLRGDCSDPERKMGTQRGQFLPLKSPQKSMDTNVRKFSSKRCYTLPAQSRPRTNLRHGWGTTEPPPREKLGPPPRSATVRPVSTAVVPQPLNVPFDDGTSRSRGSIATA